MKKFTICFLALAAGTAALQAGTINLNTGQQPGVIGTFSDPIWSIASGPTGTGMNTSGAAFIEHNEYPRSSPPNTLWQTAGLPSQTVANYISSGDCGQSAFTAACPNGTYSFTTSFVLGAGGTLTYQIAGDNQVQLYIDNVLDTNHGNMSDATGWANFSAIRNVTLGAGSHTLELRVLNAGIFTGGMLVGQVTDTPEPATYGVIAAALVGLGVLKRRKK